MRAGVQEHRLLRLCDARGELRHKFRRDPEPSGTGEKPGRIVEFATLHLRLDQARAERNHRHQSRRQPETIESLLNNLPQLAEKAKPDLEGRLEQLLAERNIRFLSYADWMKIDAAERQCSESSDKPREKIVEVAEMLRVVDQAP